jgi:peptidyl-prolyl cis-trans isomerase SurA
MRIRHIPRAELMSMALLCACLVRGEAQNPQSALQTPQPATSSDISGQPVVLDHVIGVINGDVLLESDVQSEMRFAALQPYSNPARETTRMVAAERLVNRTLILQQMDDPQQQLKLPPPTDEQVQARISELRKAIPECKRYKCETAEGWHDFLDAHGFTEQQVEERWRQRLRILQFTEARFRSGIRVPRADIEAYYNDDLLPQFAKEKVTPPPLETIESRIEEILLQQRVNAMLQDWVKSLRDQGNVLILDPSYGKSNPVGSDTPGGSA